MHNVEIKKIQTDQEYLLKEYGVFLEDTNLAVALGFFTKEEAENWISKYNNKFQREVLQII